MKKRIYYNPELKERARYLRNNSTLSEVLLWNCLKRGQMMGFDFHRQKPILNYIVDFFCYDLMLAIEIDGRSHDNHETEIYDKKRQQEIEKLGIYFLRFDDLEVKKDIGNVLRTIEYYIEDYRTNN
ncbi:MAG: endonuclease domain-containing protein [Fulvivirga sp.]